MTIAVDTNLILRVLTRDDPHQFALAATSLDEADLVAVPIVALCEAAWVLRSTAKWTGAEIARAFRILTDDVRVVVDRPLLDAGIANLENGGDFADAVIALDGMRLGGETFVTFDRAAAALLDDSALPVTLLG